MRRLRLAVPPLGLALLAAGLAACGASDTSSDTGGSCPVGGTATPCATGGSSSATAAGGSSNATGSATAAGGSSSCNPPATQRTDDFHQAVDLTALPDGLQYGDITPGSGTQAGTKSSVVVEYTGWLQDGTSFDSSRKPGRTPFAFQLGTGSVIPGWDEGVAGIKVGGVRRLVIPPSLAYGPSGQPPTIPANATLTFDIELLAVC